MFDGLNRKAIASFVIFILVFLKDILVSGFQIIPERSPVNRAISWLFVLPATLIGVVLSILVIKAGYLRKKNGGTRMFDISAIFALPLLISVNSFSQESKDTVAYISNYPVKEGYIYYYKDELPGYNDPAPYVFIFSKEDDVVALMEGQVKRIFNIEGSDCVLIKSGDTSIVYGNMDSVYKKVGDTIHKRDLIGKIKKDVTYERYELIFSITIGKKSMLYPEYINFLKQYK